MNREKKLVEKQLHDLEDENRSLFKNEDRTRNLINENDRLHSRNCLLQKEVAYGEQKVKDLQSSMSTLENEVRQLQREKSNFEEEQTNLKISLEAKNALNNDQESILTELKRDLDK